MLGPTSYIFARKKVPDSRDPSGRSVRSIVILVVNMYVYTGRCRGAHVAFTCTYSGQGARKKIWPRTYIRAGSRTPTRAYVRPGLVYMAGSERRNGVAVVFIGSQPAWTKHAMETRPGVPQNGGNNLVFDRPRWKRDPVHREGSGVPQNGGNIPPTVETGSC